MNTTAATNLHLRRLYILELTAVYLMAGGSDFDEEDQTFTLIGGLSEVYDIDLVIIDDSEPERPESEEFNVQLTSTSPLIDEQRLTIQPNTAVVIIIDNDGKFRSFTVYTLS